MTYDNYLEVTDTILKLQKLINGHFPWCEGGCSAPCTCGMDMLKQSRIRMYRAMTDSDYQQGKEEGVLM